MRNLLPALLLSAAVATCAEPVLAQGMGGMGGGGMGGGGMGGGGMGGGAMGGGGGHRRGGGGQGGQGGEGQGAQQASRPAAAVLTAADRRVGVLTVAAQAKSLAKARISAVEPDHSAVYLLRGGQLVLDTVDLVSTAVPTLLDGAHDTGLASALLIYGRSTAVMTGGSVTTSAKGTSAVYLSDDGSQATLKGVTVATRAPYAMGFAVTDGAKLDATALKVSTESDHAPAVYLRDGTAVITGGTYATSGPLSPAVAAGGDLTATGANFTAAAAGGMTIDGAHRISLIQTTLTADNVGIALQTPADQPQGAGGPGGPGGGPMGGTEGPGGGPTVSPMGAPLMNAPPSGPMSTATLTLQDGQFRSRRDAITVSNIKAAINLTHVDLQSGNGIILRAFASQWGETGRNGGNATLNTHRQVLTGDFVTDVISNITLSLQDGSTFTGKTTTNVDVALDASSTWTLTADTRVGKLSDAAITGDSVPNIVGNGHTLSYDARHNPALGGKTYQLTGGGTLAPGNGL